MEKSLRLKPRYYFRVDGPCKVIVTKVAGKWVSLVVESETEIDVKWGSIKGVTVVAPAEVTPESSDDEKKEE